MVAAMLNEIDWTRTWDEEPAVQTSRRGGSIREFTSRERFSTQQRYRRQKSHVAGPKRRLRKSRASRSSLVIGWFRPYQMTEKVKFYTFFTISYSELRLMRSPLNAFSA